MTDKPGVLYIDDEENNLISFKASFRRDFKVYTAQSAEEGFDVLRSKNAIQVIVADQRMPRMTGVEFFESSLKDFPKPIRILLTGYADIEAVIGAINSGRVFHYATKPWDEDALREIIKQAYMVYTIRQERDQELNYFVYKASHDLKGPLVSIKGLVELAIKEIAQIENVEKYLSLMDQSLDSLNKTLNDMFEYKRIDQTTLKYSKIDLKSLIHEIKNSLVHSFENKNLVWNIDVHQETSFIGDLGVLKSVLQNIIQNAMKYRRFDLEESFVNISVITTPNQCVVEIKDNGVGIREDMLEDVFKMFFRGTKEIQGSGLGLYIAKTGVEKINGTIKVHSKLQEGTTFTINVPNRQDNIFMKRQNVVDENSVQT